MKLLTLYKEFRRRETKLKKNLNKVHTSQVNLDGEAYDVYIDHTNKSVVFSSRLDKTEILFIKNDSLRKRSVCITGADQTPGSKSFRALQEAYDLVTELKIDSRI